MAGGPLGPSEMSFCADDGPEIWSIGDHPPSSTEHPGSAFFFFVSSSLPAILLAVLRVRVSLNSAFFTSRVYVSVFCSVPQLAGSEDESGLDVTV